MKAKRNNVVACCPHRGADHQTDAKTGGMAKPGGRCTLPSCKCPGWIPRHGTPIRGRGVKR